MQKIKMRIAGMILGLAVICSAVSGCGAAQKEEASDGAAQAGVSEAGEDAARFLSDADQVVIEEDTVTFTDASDRDEVTIDKYPETVVSLYSSLTTLWYEAGGTAAACIGGDTAEELYEEYIGRNITEDDGMTVIANSSAPKNWDIEQVLAMRPDLIICSTAMRGYETISGPAQAAGIPVIAVEYDDFSDYLKWFRVFCALNGREDLWESVGMQTYEEVVEVFEAIPNEGAPTVFCMYVGTETLQADTEETMVGGMVADLGGINIVGSGEGAGRLTMNLETVYDMDPDLILVEGHDMGDLEALVEEQYGDHPVWQSLNAVKEGRIYYLEKELFHNKPNRRFAQAYRILARLLYPDCGLEESGN